MIRGFTLYGDDVGLNGLYAITPRQLVAPELYSQVQVLNGASAFLNGAAPGGSGLGGSVNLVTKTAGNTPLTRATANYTSSGHFGGSFDVARRFGDGAWGLRINGAVRSGDVAIDDENRRAYVIGASLDYRGERARLFLDLAYQRYEVHGQRPTVSLGAGVTDIPRVPGASHNYGQQFTYSKLRDVFGTLRAEYDLSDKAMLYASFGARDGSEEGVYSGLTVTDAVTGAADGSASYIPYTSNNEAATGGLRVKLDAAGVTNEFNVGASYIWQVARTAYDFVYGGSDFSAPIATNLYDTPQVARPDGYHFAGGDLDDPFPITRSRLGSVFVSDTMGLWQDRLLITAGMRLQSITTKSYAYADGALSTTYDESAVTPVVGVVFKPVEGLSFFANRAEGLVQGDRASMDTNLTNPGEVFAPFKTKQYEAGAKLRLGAFNLSLAAFQIDRPSGFSISTPTPTNANAITYGIYGEQRNRGIEFSMDGEITRGLRVIAGTTYTDAKLRRTSGAVNEGNGAIGVPEWMANANVEWDLPFGATLTGRVVYTGKQWVNAANTLELDDWARVDLGARYVLDAGDKPLTLRFTVDNVANTRYWSSAFGTSSAALLQGAPRTFKASASIDF